MSLFFFEKELEQESEIDNFDKTDFESRLSLKLWFDGTSFTKQTEKQSRQTYRIKNKKTNRQTQKQTSRQTEK